jgi:hypothetical protein
MPLIPFILRAALEALALTIFCAFVALAFL